MGKRYPGVYRIICRVTSDCYVGSSAYTYSRKSDHWQALRRKTHANVHLQRAFDKYGEETFDFEILERPEVDKLVEREQYWIDVLKPAYNIRKIAESNLGLKQSEVAKARRRLAWLALPSEEQEKVKQILAEGRKRHAELLVSGEWKHSLEAIEAIKAARANQKITPAMLEALRQGQKICKQVKPKPRLGMKNSEETRRKQSESAKKRAPQSRESIERGAAKRRGRSLSLEQRQRQSLSLKRYYQSHTISEKFRQEQSERSKAFWLNITDEKRKTMSENASQAHMGLKRSEESRKKQSETLRAQERKHTEETRQLISERRKEVWERKGVTEEDRERFRAQAKSAWDNKSEEERAKAIQALQNNGSQSEEARQKRSESIKAWWAARKAAQSQQDTEQTP